MKRRRKARRKADRRQAWSVVVAVGLFMLACVWAIAAHVEAMRAQEELVACEKKFDESLERATFLVKLVTALMDSRGG